MTRGLFITSHATFNYDTFFFMLQSEYGDLYKLEMDHTGQEVHSMSIRFFDTIAPGTHINILQSGFLFLAAESSNHANFHFTNIGEEPGAIIVQGIDSPKYKESLCELPLFNPRRPQNLVAKDEIKSLAPIHDMRVEDLTGEGSP